jgi:hypothetical protein
MTNTRDVEVREEGDRWIAIMPDGTRRVFETNEAAWRWLDRMERRTSWRTPFYADE